MKAISEHANRKGQTLVRMLDAAKKARGEFDRITDELERYDHGDYAEEYEQWDPGLSFQAKIHKTQQYKREVGSRLYRTNPQFRVEPHPHLPPIRKHRAKLMEQYLNRAARETGLYHESRSILDDALLTGRGVAWHGAHPTKDGLVTTVYDTVKNLLIDPDARKWQDVKWVARRRRKARFELVNMFPEKRNSILESMSGTRKSSDEQSEVYDQGVELVEYYEVYMRWGLHNYMGSVYDNDVRKGASFVNEPKMYVVSADGLILYSGEWPVPFHMDDEWPCTVLDFYPHPKSAWPISPMSPGVGWLKAMNWIATLMVAKFQQSAKSVWAFLKINGVSLDEDDIRKIIEPNGGVTEIIELAVSSVGGDETIGKYIQQMEFTANLAEAMHLFDHVSKQFELETGLYEFLYTGSPGVQDRSAAATNARLSNTGVRINDMVSRVEEFFSRVGRKSALGARYLFDGEDVAPLLGEEAARLWGTIMPPEERNPMEWVQRYVETGVPVEEAMRLAQQQVEMSVSMDEWVMESDYSVEAGSTTRATPEAEKDAYGEALNTIVPALGDMGALESVAEILSGWGKSIGLPQESQEAIRSELSRLREQREAERQAAQSQAQAGPPAPGPQGPPQAPPIGRP